LLAACPRGHSEQTFDAVAKAIARFEAYIRHKDFKSFHIEQAKAFKRDLALLNISGLSLKTLAIDSRRAGARRSRIWGA
jgi:hypothetical protein